MNRYSFEIHHLVFNIRHFSSSELHHHCSTQIFDLLLKVNIEPNYTIPKLTYGI